MDLSPVRALRLWLSRRCVGEEEPVEAAPMGGVLVAGDQFGAPLVRRVVEGRREIVLGDLVVAQQGGYGHGIRHAAAAAAAGAVGILTDRRAARTPGRGSGCRRSSSRIRGPSSVRWPPGCRVIRRGT